MSDGLLSAVGANSALVSVSDTTTTIVAAKVGKRIAVYNYVLVCTAAAVCTWKSNTTAISGAMSFSANGGACPGGGPSPLLITEEGEALALTCAGTVEGHICWSYIA